MAPLLISGDSHITSFGAPLHGAKGENILVPLPQHGGDVFSIVGGWPRAGAYWDAVQRHAEGRAVVVYWGGNLHLGSYLLAPTPMFDLVASANPDLPLDEQATLVPEEAVRAFFAETMARFKGRLRGLRAAAVKVLYAGTPPPKEDDAFIRDRLVREPFFVRTAAQMGFAVDDVPLSPPLLRLKLWLALQGYLKDLAEECGAVFVPVPASAQTGPGYLDRACYADDATHANLAFGDRMLGALRRAAAA